MRVKSKPGLYLGCVVAILKDWAAKGCPRSAAVDHDFRAWAGACDWIVREIAGLPPLLNGHREAQMRTADPMLTALRELALAVERQGKLEMPLSTTQLLEVASNADLKIPEVNAAAEDDAGKRDAAKRMGIKLGPVFRRGDTVLIDGLSISRVQEKRERDDNKGISVSRAYVFSREPDNEGALS